MRRSKTAILGLAACALSGASAYFIGYQNGSNNANTLSQTEPASASVVQGAEEPSQARSTNTPSATPSIESLPSWSSEPTFDLEEALAPLSKLTGEVRIDYINDLFTYLAKNLPPAESLKIASDLKLDRNYAIRVLTAEWLIADKNLSIREETALRRTIMNTSGGKYGLEAELAMILGKRNAPPEVANAWMQAHSDHIGRSQIFAQLSFEKLKSDPESVLSIAGDWTPWERERYYHSMLSNLARKEHHQAWDWYSKNAHLFEKDMSSSILDTWAQSSPSSVKNLTASIEAGDQRNAAINALVKSMASRSTADAVTWADQLEDPAEQQMAYETIYENVPKGVGAMISSENGLPTIRRVIANGPLSKAGLVKGDMIAEVVDAEGTRHDLYGQSVYSAVNVLRGEPETTIELRILRTNKNSGEIEEHTVNVSRDLLIIENPKKR